MDASSATKMRDSLSTWKVSFLAPKTYIIAVALQKKGGLLVDMVQFLSVFCLGALARIDALS